MDCFVIVLALVGGCALIFLLGWLVKFFCELFHTVEMLERRTENTRNSYEELSTRYWKLYHQVEKLINAGQK